MRRLVWLGLLIWLPLVAFAAAPVSLSGLRIQPGADSTRLIFTLSEKTYGRIKYIPNPHRLIIELKNTRQHFVMHNAKLAGSNVESISSLKTANALQFILHVKNKVKWNIQFLPQEADKGVQLQIDVISVRPAAVKKSLPPVKKITVNKRIKQLDHLLAERSTITVKKPVAIAPKATALTPPHRFVVVIDAGHGGKDTGAIGQRGTQEKDVVLGIAKKLAQEINATPNMRAVLTRNGDYYVSLYNRLKLARKGDADLFVAIHADAAADKTATGASVYTLSQRGASTMAARWLALRDNHTELGDVQLNELEDQSSTLRSVLIDMAQSVTRQDSMRLGMKILDMVETIASLHYSHVEPAPFLVLKSPDIPSVLVETGYISNRREEERLANAAYQKKMAHALWQGIHQYMVQYAGT